MLARGRARRGAFAKMLRQAGQATAPHPVASYGNFAGTAKNRAGPIGLGRLIPKMYPRIATLLCLPLLAAGLLAQQIIDPPVPIPIDPPIPIPIPFPVQGETSLVLGINFGVRFVPPSRVTVPVGELLQVAAPD